MVAYSDFPNFKFVAMAALASDGRGSSLLASFLEDVTYVRTRTCRTAHRAITRKFPPIERAPVETFNFLKFLKSWASMYFYGCTQRQQ